MMSDVPAPEKLLNDQYGGTAHSAENIQSVINLIGCLPIPAWILTGKDLIIEGVNDPALTMWGKSCEAVIGKPVHEMVPEADGIQITSWMEEVLQTEEGRENKETPFKLIRNGKAEKIYVNYSCRALRYAAGKNTALLCMADDVTQSVASRMEVLEQEKRTRLAVDAALLGTFDKDLVTGKVVYSSRLYEIYGLGVDARPEDFRNMVHCEDLPIRNEGNLKALTEGSSDFEVRLVLPDGAIRWIRTRGKVFFNEAGQPMRYAGLVWDVTTQKSNEEKAARFTAIVQGSEDAIISKQLDGTITSWNASAERIFGYTSDEIIGQHISILIPPDRLDEETLIINRIRNGQRIEHFESQRLNKQGNLLTISLTVSPVKDKNGKIIGASKIVRDISQQKQVEQMMAYNSERLLIVIEASELGTWELDIKSNTLTQSARSYEIMGITDNSLNHQQILDKLHPDDLPVRNHAFNESLVTGSLHYISRILTENSIRWMEIKGRVFYDEKNVPLKMVGTIRDITDEKNYQQELQENEQKFRLLADSMTQLVWTSDVDGRYTYFNKVASRYTGTSDDPLEQGILEKIHPDDRDSYLRSWKQSLQTGSPFLYEYRLQRHDGSYRWHLSRAMAQRDAEGSVVMWVGTSTDVHDQKIMTNELEKRVELRTRELKQANSELERSNAELASFSYVASHDLQEPLRKIQTFANRILDNESKGLSETGKDYFKRMQRASARMQTLINDLLSYSRLNTREKHFEVTDLHALLQEIKNEIMRERLEEKKAILLFDQLPTLHVIPFQIRQLFINIIGNSLKFSRPDTSPVITITSTLKGGNEISDVVVPPDCQYYQITVKDNGIGFDAKYNELIFQVFQRLHGKSDYEGTGIGLAICRKILEVHRGFILARGDQETGATFTLYFPVTQESANVK